MRIAIALLVLNAAAALSQVQQRAISLPDTLGADFPIADSASGLGKATDYDFLEGVWHFTFQQRNRDGSWQKPFTGHWLAEKKAEQRIAFLPPGRQDSVIQFAALVEDHFRGDGNGNTQFNTGTWTYRAFNSQRRTWLIEGVNTSSGVWSPGVTWSDDKDRFVVQHNGGSSMVRIRYFAITANDFLWRADFTNDGGKTWIRDWWTMQATRVGR